MLHPLQDRVLVKPHKGDEISQGGIIFSDEAREKQKSKGTVLAVGPDVADEDVKKGVVVLYGRHTGDEVTDVKVSPDPLILLKYEDLLAVEK